MEPEYEILPIMVLKLRMIKERQEILPQLDIIESEYPAYFGEDSGILRTITITENLENILKNSMMKQYIRLRQYKMEVCT